MSHIDHSKPLKSLPNPIPPLGIFTNLIIVFIFKDKYFCVMFIESIEY